MRYIGVLAVLGFVLAGAGPANGTIVAVDDPFESGSWGQRFQENGVGLYDHIQAVITVNTVETTDWQSLASSGFSVAGWHNATSIDPAHILIAEGPAVTNSQFNFNFTGTKSDRFTFVFSAWRGTTLLETATVKWQGSWVITGVPNSAEQRQGPVPEPVTMAGLMMGIGVLVTYVRKRRTA